MAETTAVRSFKTAPSGKKGIKTMRLYWVKGVKCGKN
jgi:hypothetical protein